MARIKLELPSQWHFATEILVRVDDVNYGGHLGNDAVLTLIHEARIHFLKHYGFNEINIAGVGIIMADAAIVYKAQAYMGDMLTITVAVTDFSKTGCDFFYQLTQKQSGKEIARAKTGIVFFDYQQQRVVAVPDEFVNLFNHS